MLEKTLLTRGRPRRTPRASLAPDREAVGSYIDTIELIQDRKIDEDLFEKLKQSFGPGRGIYGANIVPSERESPTGFVIHRLALHRPIRETVRLLSELAKHGQKISQIAIALDILVPTREQALDWQDFFEHRLVRPLGRVPVTLGETITYFNMSVPEGTRLALYSDKKSRLVETYWACHLEARLTGARTVARMGLATAEGILGMNHRKFWSRILDLRMPPDYKRLARARNFSSNALTEASLGDELNRQAVRTLLESSKNARGVIVAQALLENMRSSGVPLDRKPLSRFRKERYDWLLPHRENVHWSPNSWA